jgi:RNA polymerase sigma-70 factor (ECF subfamily)
MTVSDHELMMCCSRGDSEAFTMLVRRWERPVGGILSRLGSTQSGNKSSPDIEDLTQDVFLRVLSACERYHNGCAFSTWIYRIALNVSRDAFRRNRTQRKLLGNHKQSTTVSRCELPESIVQKQELEQNISQALDELSPKLRDPLVLKHFGELTFTEVAEITGLPLGTVKSRVQAGLLQLQSELKRRGIDEQELES